MLEAQQTRLIGAIKKMSATIHHLEARLSSGNVGESETRDTNTRQDSDFDLNTILERYAPSSHKHNDDFSRDADHTEEEDHGSKRPRLDDQATSRAVAVSGAPVEETGPNNSALTTSLEPRSHDTTRDDTLREEAFQIDNIQRTISGLNNLAGFQPLSGSYASTATSLQPMRNIQDSFASTTDHFVDGSVADMYAARLEDPITFSSSMDTLLLRDQETASLMNCIDWDMSREISAHLLWNFADGQFDQNGISD